MIIPSLDIFALFRVRANGYVNVKSFSSHKAHRVVNNFRFCSPRLDTSLHCKTTDTGLVCRAVCLFMLQLFLVLTSPIQGGMARLSWLGWLTTDLLQILVGWVEELGWSITLMHQAWLVSMRICNYFKHDSHSYS